MKKRTILSIIFTIICVIATNKLWLVFKPIPVSFNITGSGEYKIQVVLNKKDNNEFKKTKSALENVKLSGYEDVVKLDVLRSKTPKRLKIVIASKNGTGGGGKLLVISEFYVHKQKVDFSDAKNFSVKNAKIEVENNKLYITPLNSEKIEIIYKIPLNVKCLVNFEFGIFTSIMILSFLLFLKLTGYLADFKNVKNQSRIEIVFLTIFFVFLFVPMSHISKDETSKTENRTLAKKPIFIEKSGEINYKYGKDFDSWFNDRFNLRKTFINFYSSFIYNFSIEQPSLGQFELNKKNKFFFNDLQDFYNQKVDIDLIGKNISELNNFCKDNNIRLYIVIFPQKEIIYYDLNSKAVKLPEDNVLKLANNLKNAYNIEIIYPKKEMESLKNKELVFYRTDHHATDEAQFLLYNILINKMKKDLPLLKSTSKKDFSIYRRDMVRAEYNRKFEFGNSYSHSNVKDKRFLSENYTYFDYKKQSEITILGDFPHFTHINKKGNYKLFILGDSFQESLTYFLNTSYKSIEKYRCNSHQKDGFYTEPTRKYQMEIKPYMKIIEQNKPDALLLIISTSRVPKLQELFVNVK